MESITKYDKNDEWVIGEILTLKGRVPVVSTNLHFKDVLGAWKVRWGIGRINYKINPGLYAIGKPDHTSPVLVSANYKLTLCARHGTNLASESLATGIYRQV